MRRILAVFWSVLRLNHYDNSIDFYNDVDLLIKLYILPESWLGRRGYAERIYIIVGHVFGERFNNKIVQANEYGLWLSRYIHRQPLEAGLVEDPIDYPWTSYLLYIGADKSEGMENSTLIALKNEFIMQSFGGGKTAQCRYQEFVMGDDDGPVEWGTKKIAFAIEHEILSRAMLECGLPSRVLVNPRGITERLRRQEVIRILHAKYGYKTRPLARALQMSHSTIVEILRKEKNESYGAD